MAQSYDTIIIGGGIIGACTAYEMTLRGAKVLLLEKGKVGGEQSGQNWGWVRRLGRDRREVELSLLSLKRWEFLQEKAELGFRKKGLLRPFSCEEERDEIMAQAQALQGMEYRFEYQPSHKTACNAAIACEDRAYGALYAPDEACAEPSLAARAVSDLAQANGAVVLENNPVKGLVKEKGKFVGVIAGTKDYRAKNIVIAAGAWSHKLMRKEGVCLPQAHVVTSVANIAGVASLLNTSLLRTRKVAVRQRLDGGLSMGCPGGMYFLPTLGAIRNVARFFPMMRRMVGDVLNRESFLALSSLVSGKPFSVSDGKRQLNPSASQGALDHALSNLKALMPGQCFSVQDQWAGVIDGTPDAVPYLGFMEEHKNIFLATGFSGHGFGLGPGVGYIAAQILCEERSDIDISDLSISRIDQKPEINVTF